VTTSHEEIERALEAGRLPEPDVGAPGLAPATTELGDTERWLLSFYRSSEISGALFFGRLARAQRPGPVQEDMTRHFADEAQHARYWTDCIAELGASSLNVGVSYQDQYLAAAGLPANLMEVLAITSVFERRVVNQYARHLAVPGLEPAVARTLIRIMADERWHISWVRQALQDMHAEYGADHVRATVRRYQQADREVYAATLREHEERLRFLLEARGKAR
jgi:bacterioferritin (cytochrome b1)